MDYVVIYAVNFSVKWTITRTCIDYANRIRKMVDLILDTTCKLFVIVISCKWSITPLNSLVWGSLRLAPINLHFHYCNTPVVIYCYRSGLVIIILYVTIIIDKALINISHRCHMYVLEQERMEKYSSLGCVP